MKSNPEFEKDAFELRKDIRNISRIFSFGRPANSKNETFFVDTYLKTPEMIEMGLIEDNFIYDGKEGGNLLLQVGKNTKTLFSCHTDTVDSRSIDWYPGRKKEIVIDINDMKIRKKDRTTPCLGADDGTGIWLCLEMIKAGVEGLYIFHRAEEVGGVGSSYIRNHTPQILSGFNHAIAFDRKDDFSIITGQMGQLCASQEFVDSLSEALGMGHRADPGGSFTDTANYMDIIPESTNLSVGYHNAHSGNENQEIIYLRAFRDALIKVDWPSIAFARNPNVIESRYPKPKPQPTGYKPPTRPTTITEFTEEEKLWEDYDRNNFTELGFQDDIEARSQGPLSVKDFFDDYNKYILIMGELFPNEFPLGNENKLIKELIKEASDIPMENFEYLEWFFS